MAHRGRHLASSLAYIRAVFDDYKLYSGVTSFHGRVAEIGPGDNCGVGMLFLNDGCESVDLLDRFRSIRDRAQQATIYGALLDEEPARAQRLGRYNISDDTSFLGLTWHDGEDAAAERFFTAEHGRYDYIVSRAVFEHVYDPILAFRCMFDVLNLGGMLLHKVDLRDHGMFTPDFHELKFLEVPDWLYPHMTRSSGKPNRVLIAHYRSVLEELGMKYSIKVTCLAGIGDITPHLEFNDIPADQREKSLTYIRSARSRFATSLQSMSDEDLCVAGIFIVAKK